MRGMVMVEFRLDGEACFMFRDTVVITGEILEQGKSSNGGWSRHQLALFGISGFKKGWKRLIVGHVASREVVQRFLDIRDAHLRKKSRKAKAPVFVPVDFDIPWAEQYKHPNWQKMRLFVLERDGFRCTRCGNHHRLLHVHHLKYARECFIWEIEPEFLKTVCDRCHSDEHGRDLTV